MMFQRMQTRSFVLMDTVIRSLSLEFKLSSIFSFFQIVIACPVLQLACVP